MISFIIPVVIGLIVGGVAGYYVFRYVIKGKYNQMVEAANKEADVIKEKKLLEVKEKFLNKKGELDKEIQAHNQKMQAGENKLKQREISLNQRQQELAKIRQDMEREQQRIENEKQLVATKQQELDKMQSQERAKLEEISGISAEEAKNRLVESMKDKAKMDAASFINEVVDQAKLDANMKARKS